jgi:hypothetical protein
MTNPKADHHNCKPTFTPHPSRPPITTASERQTNASSNMIEACNRLSQKLDEVAGLVREQMETGRQTHSQTAPNSIGREIEISSDVDDQATAHDALAEKTQPGPSDVTDISQQDYRAIASPVATAQTTPNQGVVARGQDEKNSVSADARGDGVEVADTSRLVDTISRAQNVWQEQAAAGRQALEAIMSHLENQAASNTPKVDVADIMSRLRELEEQQQNLQSQMSSNRWSP